MISKNFIDIFAGAGGMSLGFKKAGFTPILANDIDTNCRETYIRNFPNVPYLLEDVHNVNAEEIYHNCYTDEIDVLVGGPACQGFSLANTRTRSAENPKNNLVFEFVRLVKEIKPYWFIMENVEGLIKMDGGFFTNSIIRKLEEEYIVKFLPLCAADYGVPQIRNRVFFIGNRLGCDINIPKPKYGKERKRPHVSVNEAISDLPPIDNQTQGFEICDYVASAKSVYQKKMRGGCKKIRNHVITKSNKIVLERYSRISQGGNWSSLPNNLKSPSVRENGGHSYLYKRLNPNQPANTIANYRKAMLIHPYENRGISVREAARLQSFNDSFKFRGGISSQQQQLANVVPPLLAEAIGKEIIRNL